MIGKRTRYSLAQFLALQEPMISIVLISKYVDRQVSIFPAQLLYELLDLVRGLSDHALMLVLGEIMATSGDLRAPVNPKYRFDERMHDLVQCLQLDGYVIQGKKILQTDPSITDAAPMEDDLIDSLRSSRSPRANEIVAKILASSDAFRASPPDYNASLVNARIALETMAGDVAADVAAKTPGADTFKPAKWGEVLTFLRRCSEITPEEERGLSGVFGFLSPGAHRPVGIPEDQMTRLGRSFALNMCWFLLKNHLAPR